MSNRLRKTQRCLPVNECFSVRPVCRLGTRPNDVARFLDLGFPLAALQLTSERKWPGRLLAAGYLPLGLVGVLLTASRGGFVAAVVGLAGSGVLLTYGHPKRVLAGVLALPPLAVLLWWIVPSGSFEWLATISEQLQGGGLNQRWTEKLARLKELTDTDSERQYIEMWTNAWKDDPPTVTPMWHDETSLEFVFLPEFNLTEAQLRTRLAQFPRGTKVVWQIWNPSFVRQSVQRAEFEKFQSWAKLLGVTIDAEVLP